MPKSMGGGVLSEYISINSSYFKHFCGYNLLGLLYQFLIAILPLFLYFIALFLNNVIHIVHIIEV